MDEQETIKKDESEVATETENAGNELKAETLIDKANTSAERLEKANERKTELLRQEEDMLAKRALGGITEAGQTPRAEEKDTDEDYAKKALSGEVGK